MSIEDKILNTAMRVKQNIVMPNNFKAKQNLLFMLRQKEFTLEYRRLVNVLEDLGIHMDYPDMPQTVAELKSFRKALVGDKAFKTGEYYD